MVVGSAIGLKYSIKTTSVTVDTTRDKLPTAPLAGREYVLITNSDATTVLYIGDSTVTATGATIGTPLQPYDTYYGEWSSNVDIWGITAAGSIVAIVQEGK